MEPFKRFLQKIFKGCNKSSQTVKRDHVITIEEIDGRTCVEETLTKIEPKKRNFRMHLFMDVLICCVTCILWTSVFSLLVHLMVVSPPAQKSVMNEYLFLSSIVIIVIISVSNAQCESFMMRGFEKMAPKITIVVKKVQPKKSRILRVRKVGTREFFETEVDDTKLTYDDVLEACCKELDVDKDKVVNFLKVPETRIRNDEDIKRFRHVEYLEVHV